MPKTEFIPSSKMKWQNPRSLLTIIGWG